MAAWGRWTRVKEDTMRGRVGLAGTLVALGFALLSTTPIRAVIRECASNPSTACTAVQNLCTTQDLCRKCDGTGSNAYCTGAPIAECTITPVAGGCGILQIASCGGTTNCGLYSPAGQCVRIDCNSHN